MIRSAAGVRPDLGELRRRSRSLGSRLSLQKTKSEEESWGGGRRKGGRSLFLTRLSDGCTNEASPSLSWPPSASSLSSSSTCRRLQNGKKSCLRSGGESEKRLVSFSSSSFSCFSCLERFGLDARPRLRPGRLPCLSLDQRGFARETNGELSAPSGRFLPAGQAFHEERARKMKKGSFLKTSSSSSFCPSPLGPSRTQQRQMQGVRKEKRGAEGRGGCSLDHALFLRRSYSSSSSGFASSSLRTAGREREGRPKRSSTFCSSSAMSLAEGRRGERDPGGEGGGEAAERPEKRRMKEEEEEGRREEVTAVAEEEASSSSSLGGSLAADRVGAGEEKKRRAGEKPEHRQVEEEEEDFQPCVQDEDSLALMEQICEAFNERRSTRRPRRKTQPHAIHIVQDCEGFPSISVSSSSCVSSPDSDASAPPPVASAPTASSPKSSAPHDHLPNQNLSASPASPSTARPSLELSSSSSSPRAETCAAKRGESPSSPSLSACSSSTFSFSVDALPPSLSSSSSDPPGRGVAQSGQAASRPALSEKEKSTGDENQLSRGNTEGTSTRVASPSAEPRDKEEEEQKRQRGNAGHQWQEASSASASCPSKCRNVQEIEREEFVVVDLDKLRRESKLTFLPVQTVLRALVDKHPGMYVWREGFVHTIQQLLADAGIVEDVTQASLNQAFDVLDKSANEIIDLLEAVRGLPQLCRATHTDRIQALFALFDRRGSARLHFDEMMEVFCFIYRVMLTPSVVCQFKQACLHFTTIDDLALHTTEHLFSGRYQTHREEDEEEQADALSPKNIEEGGGRGGGEGRRLLLTGCTRTSPSSASSSSSWYPYYASSLWGSRVSRSICFRYSQRNACSASSQERKNPPPLSRHQSALDQGQQQQKLRIKKYLFLSEDGRSGERHALEGNEAEEEESGRKGAFTRLVGNDKRSRMENKNRKSACSSCVVASRSECQADVPGEETKENATKGGGRQQQEEEEDFFSRSSSSSARQSRGGGGNHRGGSREAGEGANARQKRKDDEEEEEEGMEDDVAVFMRGDGECGGGVGEFCLGGTRLPPWSIVTRSTTDASTVVTRDRRGASEALEADPAVSRRDDEEEAGGGSEGHSLRTQRNADSRCLGGKEKDQEEDAGGTDDEEEDEDLDDPWRQAIQRRDEYMSFEDFKSVCESLPPTVGFSQSSLLELPLILLVKDVLAPRRSHVVLRRSRLHS